MLEYLKNLDAKRRFRKRDRYFSSINQFKNREEYESWKKNIPEIKPLSKYSFWRLLKQVENYIEKRNRIRTINLYNKWIIEHKI